MTSAATRRDGQAPAQARLLPASLEILSQLPLDALVSFVFADVMPLSGSLGLIDWYLCGAVTTAVRNGTFQAAPGERLLVPTFGRLRPPAVFLFGLGPLMDCDGERLGVVGRDVVRVCADARLKRVAGCLPHAGSFASASRQGHATFCGDSLQTTLRRAEASLSVPVWLMAPDGLGVPPPLAKDPPS